MHLPLIGCWLRFQAKTGSATFCPSGSQTVRVKQIAQKPVPVGQTQLFQQNSDDGSEVSEMQRQPPTVPTTIPDSEDVRTTRFLPAAQTKLNRRTFSCLIWICCKQGFKSGLRLLQIYESACLRFGFGVAIRCTNSEPTDGRVAILGTPIPRASALKELCFMPRGNYVEEFS